MGIDFTLERAWKLVLLVLVITALGFLIITFISFIGGHASNALSSMGAVQVLSIAPSNLSTVIGISITVKTAGTVYVSAVNFINTKMTILS
jgi:hypothetical protein